MKNEQIIDSWNKIEPDSAADERMLGAILAYNRSASQSAGQSASNSTSESKKDEVFKVSKTIKWNRLAPIAACLALIVAVSAIAIFSNRSDFDLTLSSGASVRILDNPPNIQGSASLVYLSEEELFAERFDGTPIAAFEGTVVNVENIVIDYGVRPDFSGRFKDYRAIVTVEVSNVFRGDIESGALVTVLLPAPVQAIGDESEVRVTGTSVSSQMTVGTTGIFMPMKYDETSYMQSNEKTVYLQELAEYGLGDGERWAFLEKAGEVLFARHAYEGIADATTMDEVREYVTSMLDG